MENPFESFDKRLESIEDKLANLISNLESGKSTNSTTWITTNQLGVMLQVTTRTIQNWRDDGSISFYKVGRKILYKEEDIDHLITKNYSKAWK